MAIDRFVTTVIIEHITDKAILIKHNGDDVWLPLSQIEIEGEVASGEMVEVTIPEWLAVKKDLI